jgi:hypothetical protein
MTLRVSITKSRRGHYTVAIFVGPRRVYHQTLVSGLSRAREIAKERTAEIQREIDDGAAWLAAPRHVAYPVHGIGAEVP